ncbi:MAG: DNA adenine methylase [Candidatus Omnitrophica bacterium]|nr:DNA adenine methylase [Candidatus Omnitrophota bacterium]
MWSRFKALPSYFGGKRQLCPAIFRELSQFIPRDRWQNTTLVDGFCGGGAVSLYAKAQGMRVLANDLAERSKIVIDALIANDRVTICQEDIHRLFAVGPNGSRFVEEHFVPSMFMVKHARFIDGALSVTATVEHATKRQLLRLLLIRYMFAVTPYSQIHSVNYYQWIEDEAFHRLGMSRTKKVPYTCMHPLRILEAVAEQINKGVFPNGHRNEAHQRDVFDFLAQAEGDICYLDPPYAGAQAYEKFYEVLDQVLEQQVRPFEASPFNSEKAKELLARLLEATRKFRVVVVSYGSQRYSLEEFADTIRSVEPAADIRPVNFRYAIGSKSNQESLRKELLAVIHHG